MRGRKPHRAAISRAEYQVLNLIARGEAVPPYQAQRARIVLEIAAGERTRDVAKRVGCDEATVWRACRRYEQAGLSGLLADGRRSRSTTPSALAASEAARAG
jgi:hypothetical protein